MKRWQIWLYRPEWDETFQPGHKFFTRWQAERSKQYIEARSGIVVSVRRVSHA